MADDMNAPATRADVKELRADLVQEMDEREARLVKFVVKAIEDSERRVVNALKVEISASERRLLAELGRHTKSSVEQLTGQLAAVDQKYQDLPERVTRLEDEVFSDE